MRCVCCLLSPDNRKDLSNLTATDKRTFNEVTKLEIKVNSKLKICIKCKEQLKSSVEFIRLCSKSYHELDLGVETEVIVKVEPAVRQKRTRRSLPAAEEVEDSARDCTIDDDEQASVDDELPANDYNELILDETETTERIEEGLEAVKEEPSPDSSKRSGKFPCHDCSLSFQTAQRLEVHSFTHSGIKNWKCEYCDKVFATKFRLKAHISKFIDISLDADTELKHCQLS